ncbi:MAG: hypothetical protein KatS3mg023_3168 [Armatimonadota bacterium]|nr:MAG: hypothetical protein KatS3mg023_3168 [Armatimonadota bacterium]
MSDNWNARWDALADRLTQMTLQRYPEMATYLGVHTYDHQVYDYSESARDAEIRALYSFFREMQSIPREQLSPERALDYALLEGEIRHRLIDLESWRSWTHDPDTPNSLVVGGVFVLAKRSFAPPEERFKAVIARLKQAPTTFAHARRQLTEPAREPTEIAIQQVKATIGFYERSLPAAFREVKDTSLWNEFEEVNREVIDTYRAYAAWLEEEVLPRAEHPFAIGERHYSLRLKWGEGVEMPLEKLIDIGKRELQRLQEEFVATAAQIDPHRSPREVFDEIAQDHPTAEELIPFTQQMLEELRQFCIDREIVTIPSDVRCRVEETPEFMRELTFASMDTPGPFEEVATEAYYNVTLPAPDWSPEDVEAHLRAFNRYNLTAISIHEAYPGHYVQFLWLKHAPTRLRKMLGSYSNAEGWAHYCEELFMELGYQADDPRYRLAQLHEALLRACRYVAGFGMHTQGMSLEEAKQLFIEQGHMEPINAEREAKRGTVDPMYCNYTLGKLLLLQLREDLKRKQGDAFSLRRFHDEYLQAGFPPIPLLREQMLGEVGEVL